MRRIDLERGSSSVETAVLAPVLILLLGLVLAVANVAVGQQSVTTAAHAAARSASLATSRDDAAERIRSTLTTQLRADGTSCTSLSVDVDDSAFTTSPGRTAVIRAQISCTVPYAQLIPVPGLPGVRTITVQTTSPLDTYRERS